MNVNTKEDLNPDCDIAESKEAVESKQVTVKGIADLLLQRRVYGTTVPPELHPMQTFPVHIMRFLSNVYKDEALLESADTFFFCNGLKNGTEASTILVLTNFYRLTRQLTDSR